MIVENKCTAEDRAERFEKLLRTKRFADFNNTQQLYKHVFKTPNSLRHYVFYSSQNGLDGVISRLGKKLIFDLDKLDVWLAQGGAK